MSSTIDIYTAHFGLTARPFALAPDPDFLFWGTAHMRAYAILEYGLVTRAPITLITGEVGAGKTTLLHHLLRQVSDDVTIGLIQNAYGNRQDLLRWVLLALDQPAPSTDTHVDLFARFESFVISEYAQGKRVILVFDEAQNLTRDTLEDLRIFTNINSGKDELIQLVLVGQPELRDIVLSPDLTQFAQRVAASFHLTAMDAPSVTRYIGHRLSVVGGSPETFTDKACALIHERTGGVPRLVNQLCDLSMVYAFTNESTRVSVDVVRQVLDDNVFFAGGLRPEPARLVDPIPLRTPRDA